MEHIENICKCPKKIILDDDGAATPLALPAQHIEKVYFLRGSGVAHGLSDLDARPFEKDVMLVKSSENRELTGARVDFYTTSMTKEPARPTKRRSEIQAEIQGQFIQLRPLRCRCGRA